MPKILRDFFSSYCMWSIYIHQYIHSAELYIMYRHIPHVYIPIYIPSSHSAKYNNYYSAKLYIMYIYIYNYIIGTSPMYTYLYTLFCICHLSIHPSINPSLPPSLPYILVQERVFQGLSGSVLAWHPFSFVRPPSECEAHPFCAEAPTLVDAWQRAVYVSIVG